MKNIFQKCFRCICVSLFLCGALAMEAADSLSWRTRENRVDADIQSWNLQKFLEKISSATGWEIYVEPGTSHQVSAKFSDVPTDEALKRLLGKLNFALLPQTNAAPKFLVYRTSMGQATQLIRGQPAKESKKDDNLIPNELIVTLAKDSKMTIEELAKLLKAQIVGRSDSLRAYRLRFADEEAAEAALEKLNATSDVAAVDRNYFIDAQPPVAKLPLGSSAPFPLNPTPANDPKNIVVGLIDTAMQSLGPEMDGFVLPQISVAGESPKNVAGPMHATFMGKTIITSANHEGLKILPIDVYGMREYTTTYEIGLGINEAVSRGAKVINLSLGTSGDSPFLETLINNLAQKNILFYAAAGNEPVASPTYPAAYSTVNAVTAGRDGLVSSFANYGNFVDIMAPPSDIGHFGNQAFLVTGTSTSTAYASGLAVSLLGKGLSPLQAQTSIRQAWPFTFTRR